MLKKTIHIALALVVLVGAIGFSVSKHYCGSRLVSISIDSEAKSCCGDEGSSNCCKNKTTHFHLDEKGVNASSAVVVTPSAIKLLFPTFLVLNVFEPCCSEVNLQFVEDSPPPIPLSTHLAFFQTYLI